MTYEGPLPPGHSSAEDINVSFPQLEGNAISVVMPVAYGPPSVSFAMYKRCVVCGQGCWVSPRAINVDMPRVCWGCIDEQVPGFVERKLRGEG